MNQFMGVMTDPSRGRPRLDAGAGATAIADEGYVA